MYSECMFAYVCPCNTVTRNWLQKRSNGRKFRLFPLRVMVLLTSWATTADFLSTQQEAAATRPQTARVRRGIIDRFEEHLPLPLTARAELISTESRALEPAQPATDPGSVRSPRAQRPSTTSGRPQLVSRPLIDTLELDTARPMSSSAAVRRAPGASTLDASLSVAPAHDGWSEHRASPPQDVQPGPSQPPHRAPNEEKCAFKQWRLLRHLHLTGAAAAASEPFPSERQEIRSRASRPKTAKHRSRLPHPLPTLRGDMPPR